MASRFSHGALLLRAFSHLRSVVGGRRTLSNHNSMHFSRLLIPIIVLLSSASFAEDAPSINPALPAITLREALARSLERSPELKSYSWDIRAAEARILQAGFKPNPELSMEIQDPTGSGALKSGKQMEQTIQLSQLIERGGKRDARVAEARAERVVIEWDYQVKRIEVMKDTTLAFLDVLAAQQTLKLATETVSLLEKAIAEATKRVDAAKAQAVEAIRAKVAMQSATIDVEHAEHDLDIVRSKLASMWGAKQINFGDVQGDLDSQPQEPNLAELRAKLARNPELARWQAVREAREATVKTQKTHATQDVTLFGGPRVVGRWDDVGGVIGVSIPLPWNHRNEGNIAQAEALANKTHDEKRAVEARASAALDAAYQELMRAGHEAGILKTQLLPQAESAVEQLSTSYDAGRSTQLEVLDARRTLIAARQQRLLATKDYHKALAEIEALTAAPERVPSAAQPASVKTSPASK